MRRFAGLIWLLGVLMVPQAVQGQEPVFSIEPRVGYAVPVGEWAEDDALRPGPGYGVIALYSVVPQVVRLYVGYERYRFGLPEETGQQTGDTFQGDATSEGFRGGARVLVPLGGAFAPFLEGGVVHHRVRTSVWTQGFRFGATSARAIGFEAGGGFIVDLPTPPAYPVRLAPAVRYRQHPLEYPDLPTATSGTAASIAIELGISFDY